MYEAICACYQCIGGAIMAFDTFTREVDAASAGAYASYTLCDNGVAIYEDSDGRRIEAGINIDILCLFCTVGKMPLMVRDQIISMMQ